MEQRRLQDGVICMLFSVSNAGIEVIIFIGETGVSRRVRKMLHKLFLIVVLDILQKVRFVYQLGFKKVTLFCTIKCSFTIFLFCIVKVYCLNFHCDKLPRLCLMNCLLDDIFYCCLELLL